MSFGPAVRLLACLCMAGTALCASPLAAEPGAEDFAGMGAAAQAQGLDALAIYRYGQALALESGRQDWQDRLKELRAARLAAAHGDGTEAQAVPGTDETLEHGLAAWADGPPEALAGILNRHNRAAPRSQQVLYVFLPCGQLETAGGRLHLLWDPSPALDLAGMLSGDTVVLPLISGSLRSAATISPEEWRAVAKTLASRLESQPRLGGLAFDLEPMPPQSRALFAALRQGTRRPLMAVLGPDQAEAYGWVDVALVRGFHDRGDGTQAAAPALTRQWAGAVAAEALADARAVHRHFLFGLPASATPREFEWAQAAGRADMVAGHSQTDYFDAALSGLTGILRRTDEEFLGAALWEVRPEGFAALADGARLWPAALSGPLWERLNEPLTQW